MVKLFRLKSFHFKSFHLKPIHWGGGIVILCFILIIYFYKTKEGFYVKTNPASKPVPALASKPVPVPKPVQCPTGTTNYNGKCIDNFAYFLAVNLQGSVEEINPIRNYPACIYYRWNGEYFDGTNNSYSPYYQLLYWYNQNKPKTVQEIQTQYDTKLNKGTLQSIDDKCRE